MSEPSHETREKLDDSALNLNYVVIVWPLNLKEAADSQTGNVSHSEGVTAS